MIDVVLTASFHVCLANANRKPINVANPTVDVVNNIMMSRSSLV
jgi:hypothetical protein